MALWERRSLVVARQCQHQRFRSCRCDCVPAGWGAHSDGGGEQDFGAGTC